jgi:LPXTG-site transpeptidase (sortase) family protein
MKLRFLKFFVLTFVVIFTVLNGRFAFVNLKYWLSIGPLPITINNEAEESPLSPGKPAPALPEQAILKIDSLGISAPIIFGAGSDLKNIYNNLEKGTVHYSGTPKPGLEGTSIILGHSSAYPWYKGQYGSVFALLGKLKPGDKFRVQYDNKTAFTFVIRQSIVFSPFSNDARLTEIEKTPGSTVVLISCWPIGTNYKRIAVQAELI